MEASRLKPWNLLNFSRISCAYLFYWEEYKLLKLKFEVPDTYFWHIFSFVNNNLTPEMTNIRLSIVRIFWKFMLNCTFKLQLTLRYPGISYPSIQGLPSPRGKKGVFEISQNSQGKTCSIVSFLIKLQAWGQQLY